MSRYVKLSDKIEIGHNINYERNTFIKKSNRTTNIDTNKIFHENKCVIHLINLEHNKNRMDFFLKNNPDISAKTIGKTTATYITNYLSDQHSELWNMMKRGDLIEDISSSGYRSVGRFIVDIDPNNKDLGITRNGLIVKDLYREYNSCGTIYPDMCIITEFPINYFDNLVVNSYLCGPMMKSYWHCDLSSIALDTHRLRLDKLNSNNIFHSNYKLPDNDDSVNADADYLYIIVKFKKINYMIISEYSNRYSKYDMKKEIKNFIKLFKKQKLFERYDHMDDDNILLIAKSENVIPDNICKI